MKIRSKIHRTMLADIIIDFRSGEKHGLIIKSKFPELLNKKIDTDTISEYLNDNINIILKFEDLTITNIK